MRADRTLTIRRVDAAESALHLGAALALAGIACASIPLAAVGAAIVLAASAWAGLETMRDEVVTRWDAPRDPATRYQPGGAGDGAHRDAPRNRRVAR